MWSHKDDIRLAMAVYWSRSERPFVYDGHIFACGLHRSNGQESVVIEDVRGARGNQNSIV